MASRVERVNEIISKARSEGRSKLLEHEAYETLSLYGIPVPKAGLARNADEAAELARKVGFPVVLKIVSPDIVHKSDVGGVKVNVKSEEEAVKCFNEIIENARKYAPNARIAGVLVQEMVPSALEVIIGATRDPTFGPVLMFGLGGIFVEVLKDVSFRIAPLEPIDAEEMIKEVKGYKILEGYRGMPPRDVDAIKNILLRLSKFVEEFSEVQDVDLNPIMVYEKGKGAYVVDARIILRT